MNVEEFRDYCLAKEDVEESMPFGPDVLVFKVRNKMFALCDLDGFERINLKCEPEEAERLREAYPEISPGYHMNKTHWNSVSPKGKLKRSMLEKLIDKSYHLVLESTVKKKRK